MFKRALKWLGGIVVVLLLVAAVFVVNAVWFRPWSLNVFYEKVFIEFMFDNPELLSSIGLVEQFGITGHNAKLNDESPAHQQRQFHRLKRNIADLRAYPLEKQDSSQRLSTAVLDWFLSVQAEAERFQFHDYPVNQLFGVQSRFPSFMANTHRLLAPRDCEYYLRRLEALPAKWDQVLESVKLREQKGVIPPRFVVEKVLKEMSDFVAAPPAENILATSFKERVAKIAKLNEAERADYQRRVEEHIGAIVYPSYQKLIAYFADLLPKTTTDDGVWKLPDGEAYYAHMLRQNTTTRLNPQEIHSLGVAEVARIESEMRGLLDGNGYAGQPIGAAMKALAADVRFLFPNDDNGRSAAIGEYTRLINEALERSKQLFLTLPQAPVEVRRVPEFKEATAPGAYYEPPALDRTRPGVFYANLRDMTEVPKWGMPTLSYHEAVPGHHFQLTVAQELKGVPQFRKMIPFTAYSEGWALYTEWLARQAGWYEGDPFGDLGRLQAELFRAVRLVVDTGIHAQRWTREQAIAYMLEKTGIGEKDVTAEIERYIVNPGQACAYKVGMLKIQELREQAQRELGDKWDEREFHDVVLKNGALPLEILEQQVNGWIRGKRPL
ncbi:MAG TPA: DUF885 domain-containing protein [Chthoniobacterales bacterium]|nr:DUF885 domain-containing protein [Chthoniobacterales bacterium]